MRIIRDDTSKYRWNQKYQYSYYFSGSGEKIVCFLRNLNWSLHFHHDEMYLNMIVSLMVSLSQIVNCHSGQKFQFKYFLITTNSKYLQSMITDHVMIFYENLILLFWSKYEGLIPYAPSLHFIQNLTTSKWLQNTILEKRYMFISFYNILHLISFELNFLHIYTISIMPKKPSNPSNPGISVGEYIFIFTSYFSSLPLTAYLLNSLTVREFVNHSFLKGTNLLQSLY